MAERKKILIQLDGDPHPSVFDRVVALDAGAEHVFAYGRIEPGAVRDLVYGGIFTRGGEDLRRTAIFIGGQSVSLGEEILAAVKKAFFGPMRVSVLLDCNGANTTAAASVVLAARHQRLSGARALVLGSTGPVGRRVARLLARRGALVRVGSRSLERARDVVESIRTLGVEAPMEPVATAEPASLAAALDGAQIVVAAGGPGACLLPRAARASARALRVAIDLNAVPPEGIEGVKGTDAAIERDGHIAYGAIGVGGLKMKIHKRAIARLFEANDVVLDAEEILELGSGL